MTSERSTADRVIDTLGCLAAAIAIPLALYVIAVTAMGPLTP